MIRRVPATLLVAACLHAGCAAGGSGNRPDASDLIDESVDATLDGSDDGPRPCASNADCNDGVDCTQDRCTVAGTCQNTAMDSLCPEGTHCHLTEGCVEGCEEDSDCDDGVWCNGVERCMSWGCDPDLGGRDCNDGNPCTLDDCDEERDTCTHDLYPECETDVVSDPGDPFDPDVHYSGTFDIAPFPAQECPALNYEVRWIQMSDTGSALRITAGPFTLTESPRPGSATFSATGTNGCMTVTVSGTFSNADTFTGRWLNVLDGSCPLCSPQDIVIGGLRR